LTEHKPLACEGRDDLFFPEDDDYNTPKTEQARALCRACPKLVECRQRGLDNEEPYGIWGGLTPEDRREALNVV
jgi:WhiB family redox-sensing transcriptional regulator